MYFEVSAELPSGTRLRLQNTGKIWVATFAAHQFVIKPAEPDAFIERARLWCEGNIAGASLSIAFGVVRHFAALVSEVEGAEAEQFAARYSQDAEAPA